MKRVLIVFPFQHQFSVVEGKCDFLNSHGLRVDAYLIQNWKFDFYTFGRNTKPLIFLVLKYLYGLLIMLPGIYRFGIDKSFQLWIYKSIINRYDIIELAGVYSEFRLQLARYAKAKGKKVNVAIWGSDFYGITDYQNDWRKELFDIADQVSMGTKKMKNDFINAYPEYKNKIYQSISGLTQFEKLKDILEGSVDKDTSFLENKYEGKIILTIGYSGRTWQQHFYAIDALEKISRKNKDKLFLIVPMTYDANPEYKNYIENRLSRLGIPYQILEKRLSLEQNLSMRIISDIAICIQNTDALAASVREHIMAGSVFIGGDWLPYSLFLNEGMYFRPTSLDNLSNTIEDVIENIKEEKRKCLKNTELMYNYSSWTKRGEDYLKMYDITGD